MQNRDHTSVVARYFPRYRKHKNKQIFDIDVIIYETSSQWEPKDIFDMIIILDGARNDFQLYRYGSSSRSYKHNATSNDFNVYVARFGKALNRAKPKAEAVDVDGDSLILLT
jgi:hypothetical protein